MKTWTAGSKNNSTLDNSTTWRFYRRIEISLARTLKLMSCVHLWIGQLFRLSPIPSFNVLPKPLWHVRWSKLFNVLFKPSWHVRWSKDFSFWDAMVFISPVSLMFISCRMSDFVSSSYPLFSEFFCSLLFQEPLFSSLVIVEESMIHIRALLGLVCCKNYQLNSN